MKEKYTLIPGEFYKDKNLKGLERDVLALYKYYTENGNNKCCSLNSVQIAEYFDVSPRYIKSVRKRLKELGYISTNGGIKVTYIGIEKGTTVPPKGEPQFTSRGSTVHPGVNHSSPQKGTTVPLKGEPQFPHKEEKEDKKEIKKEEKSEMTNFELFINNIPSEYRTPERIDYIKDNYIEAINKSDFNESGVLEWCLKRIMTEVYQKYPVEYNVEKKEPVSKF